MIDKIIGRVQSTSPWVIVLFSVVSSEILTLAVVSVIELALKGVITWDYIFTGAVTALLVSFVIVAMIVFVLARIRENEKFVATATGLITENRERYRQIFQQSSDYILMLEKGEDGIFKITDCSDSAFEKLGYLKDELVGMPITSLIGQKFKPFFKERTELIQSADGAKFETEHVMKDGRLLNVEVITKLITISGKQFVYAVHRDITERKELETRQKELLAGIEFALADAQRERKNSEEASRLKSEFIANISHELNTPLTSVLGYSHIANDKDKEISNDLSKIILLLRGGDDSPGAREMADTADKARLAAQESIKCNSVVLEQGQKLNVLINDLIDFSRLDSGQSKVESQPVSAYLLLDALERSQTKPAKAKNLALKCNTQDFQKEDLVFIGDGRKLEKILESLVDNAIKFSNDGEINVTAGLDGGLVFFRVADHGVGINENEKEKVFDLFRQLDGSFSRAQGGLGLGLTLARKLVQAMGGNIELKSEIGKGSEFTVTIPYRSIHSEK